MNQPAQRIARYEDLFDLPYHIIGEIIHGQLITQSRPAPKYARFKIHLNHCHERFLDNQW